jgi:hypothetical protein
MQKLKARAELVRERVRRGTGDVRADVAELAAIVADLAAACDRVTDNLADGIYRLDGRISRTRAGE